MSQNFLFKSSFHACLQRFPLNSSHIKNNRNSTSIPNLICSQLKLLAKNYVVFIPMIVLAFIAKLFSRRVNNSSHESIKKVKKAARNRNHKLTREPNCFSAALKYLQQYCLI